MGLSPTHLILILIVVLFVFGPKRLPGLGKGIGEAIKGFKKGLHGDEIDVTPKNHEEALQHLDAAPNRHQEIYQDIHVDSLNSNQVKNKQKQDT